MSSTCTNIQKPMLPRLHAFTHFLYDTSQISRSGHLSGVYTLTAGQYYLTLSPLPLRETVSIQCFVSNNGSYSKYSIRRRNIKRGRGDKVFERWQIPRWWQNTSARGRKEDVAAPALSDVLWKLYIRHDKAGQWCDCNMTSFNDNQATDANKQ